MKLIFSSEELGVILPNLPDLLLSCVTQVVTEKKSFFLVYPLQICSPESYVGHANTHHDRAMLFLPCPARFGTQKTFDRGRTYLVFY